MVSELTEIHILEREHREQLEAIAHACQMSPGARASMKTNRALSRDIRRHIKALLEVHEEIRRVLSRLEEIAREERQRMPDVRKPAKSNPK